MIRKTLLSILSVGLLVVPATTFGATTVADLQAQIQVLLKQINELQAQIAMQGSSAQWCHAFNVNKGVGSQGDEISALGVAFTKEGLGNFTGSKFDENLASAVSTFQEKYKDEVLTPAGLAYGTGYVGPRTRAKLNLLYGCGNKILSTLPSVTIISPNGGERYPRKSTQTFRWKASGVPSIWKEQAYVVLADEPHTRVMGFVNRNSNGVINGNDMLLLPQNPGKYKIELVINDTYTDFSDNAFEVYIAPDEPSFKIISPNGGEQWVAGSRQTIKWSAVNIPAEVETVNLILSGEGLISDILIAKPSSGTGYYDWIVPDTLGTYTITVNCYIPTLGDIACSSDRSDAPFSIVVATSTTSAPTLISPAFGAVLDNGRTDRQDSIIWDFDWSDVPGATTYEIAITKNSGLITYNDTKVIAQSSYHYVSESAVITETDRYGWSWRVRALVNRNWSDWSDARSFEVEPVNTDQLGPPPHITVLSPNGGEVWTIGSRQTIKWSSLNVPSEQILSIGARGFGSFTQMGEDGKPHIVSQKDFPLVETANTGSINIETSNLQPGMYQVFIKTAVNSVLANDFSDALFTIVASLVQN